MYLKRFIFLAILVVCCGAVSLSGSVVQAQQPSSPRVTHADTQGLTMVWEPPAYTMSTVHVDGQPYTQITMPETAATGRPGYPQLPFYSSLVGLPPTGEASLRIVDLDYETVSLSHPVLPAPLPQSVDTDTLQPVGGSVVYAPDSAAYNSDIFYPATVAKLGPVEQLRQNRVARLTINPLRVNPVTNQMDVVRRVQLEITFTQPAPAAMNAQATSIPTPFGEAFATMLVNPHAAQWRATPTPFAQQPINAAAYNDPLKVSVTEAGLYALTYNDLLAVGWPVDSIDPRTLQMSYGWPRQNIAILIEGESDGVFNANDRLLFYAAPEYSRYTAEAVYFLDYGQSGVLRMANRDASPGALLGVARRTVTAETNQIYVPEYVDHNDDYWYWERLHKQENPSGSYNFQLRNPLAGGPDAALTIWLQGVTTLEHRVTVRVNGNSLGQHTWNGEQAVELNLAVPMAYLNSGTNQLQLSLDSSIQIIYVDALALTYSTSRGGAEQLALKGEADQKTYTLTHWPGNNLNVYEITNPDQPLLLNGYQLTGSGSYTLQWGDNSTIVAEYLVVPDDQMKSPTKIEPTKIITDPPTGADYIIITHPDFSAAVASLATHRTNSGLRVATIDVESIYDTYGPGVIDPTAIKNFLAYAYVNWTAPAPTYVLLVGDGNFDFRRYGDEQFEMYGTYNPLTFIPPYMAPVDPTWGDTASDNQFVTVAGNDALPDMLIGRLAVSSAAQVQTVVNKIINYETNPASGNWNVRHLFVADEPVVTDFHVQADDAYTQLQAPQSGRRYYYDDDTGGQSYLYDNVNTLRSNFLSGFNQGAGVVTFHGHSSWLQWTQDGILRHKPPVYNEHDDLTDMDNQSRLPVILEMTCFTGSFHRPEAATLDESLLNLSGGGAVAVWGSTGLGVATGHEFLQEGFYQTVTSQPTPKLGAAILAGQIELYASGFNQDLLDTFILFGDPALELDFTVPTVSYTNQVYLPIVLR